jgi:uncharacterized protein (TIGR02453 family)
MGSKARGKTIQFGPEVFGFLIELSLHNDRDWFQENKGFYESAVKTPLLSFIEEFAPHLERISPHFRADARSMFRIHRDVRFSKDKRPYKTHAAAHFRHVAGKDVHAPGFYLHIEPGSVFAGGGIWRPDAGALAQIRQHIVRNPGAWQGVVNAPAFRRSCELRGDALKRPPRNFDPDHPLIEDLKRKDFIAMVELDDSDVLAPDFVKRFARACRTVAPLSGFLCEALGVPF